MVTTLSWFSHKQVYRTLANKKITYQIIFWRESVWLHLSHRIKRSSSERDGLTKYSQNEFNAAAETRESLHPPLNIICV